MNMMNRPGAFNKPQAPKLTVSPEVVEAEILKIKAELKAKYKEVNERDVIARDFEKGMAEQDEVNLLVTKLGLFLKSQAAAEEYYLKEVVGVNPNDLKGAVGGREHKKQ